MGTLFAILSAFPIIACALAPALVVCLLLTSNPD